MQAHIDLIQRFYEAFQRRDAATMAACYHADAHFSDPVFPSLDADGVRTMWHMLCERGTDLQIEFSQLVADNHRGSAHWDAHYTFSSTGRKVFNRVDAQFEFRDGLILRHQDRFSFSRWAMQALGPVGRLLGHSRWLQRKVQKQAAAGLEAYRRKTIA
jgi:ketosteroid isomerase-like protein